MLTFSCAGIPRRFLWAEEGGSLYQFFPPTTDSPPQAVPEASVAQEQHFKGLLGSRVGITDYSPGLERNFVDRNPLWNPCHGAYKGVLYSDTEHHTQGKFLWRVSITFIKWVLS